MRMLHLFQWKLKDITDNVQYIKEAGYTTNSKINNEKSKNSLEENSVKTKSNSLR